MCGPGSLPRSVIWPEPRIKQLKIASVGDALVMGLERGLYGLNRTKAELESRKKAVASRQIIASKSADGCVALG